MEMIELDERGLSTKKMRIDSSLGFLRVHPAFSFYPPLIIGF